MRCQDRRIRGRADLGEPQVLGCRTEAFAQGALFGHIAADHQMQPPFGRDRQQFAGERRMICVHAQANCAAGAVQQLDEIAPGSGVILRCCQVEDATAAMTAHGDGQAGVGQVGRAQPEYFECLHVTALHASRRPSQ